MKTPALLTDSEWRVMRVLWEKSTCTAAAVTAALVDETAWSPTTVKTFLSRLCVKGLIAFASDHGKYLYSPAASERDCVVAEMKAVLNRVYGGIVRGETEHFVFYGVDDATLVRRLGECLETFHDRLVRDFGYRRGEKQIVYLYQSIHRMHSALGLQAGPDWLRASGDWDILHLAPERLFDDMTIEQAASHVWVQIIVRDLSPQVPYWFEQGFAAYESGWIGKDRFDRAMQRQAQRITTKTIPN
ncbi:MAG: BlaI/MecI/CopY family transcriptional regulator, partial [Bacillota bacterium]|nr:BlaI/MecI/CopY family transcriptional regulator [Bacillota bacterium]